MTLQTVRDGLAGISGVHVVPYAADGSVDHTLLARIVSDIAAAGIHNIVSAGNTGEFFSLTEREVLAVQATTIEAVAGKSLVTAAVGRSLTEAIATGRAAKACGADAIMSHHPNDPFAAPQSQADYFIALADSVDLPLVAYVRTDALGVANLVRIANHPNVAGVKFANTNLMQLAECVRATQGGPAVWVCGLAEGWAAPFYALGARGFTSGLVNVDPARSLAIWRALHDGDFAAARTLFNPIVPFETLRTRFNNGANVTVVKQAMALMGYPVGPARLPNLPALDHADAELLATVIKSWQDNPVINPATAHQGALAAE
jgi:4-hydroxy-tetrahydrodipicolinate synthase